MEKPPRILICETCQGPGIRSPGILIPGPADLAALADAIAASDLEGRVTLEGTACLGGCADPVSIGLQGEGRASYVFSGIDLEADRADILATCRVYLDSPAGWIEDARPCGRLRNRLRARIPAL